jgi:CRP-like cAMP-binding protein
LVLKRKPFQDLLRQNPALSDAVLWNVIRQFSERLRATNDKVMMFLSASGLY